MNRLSLLLALVVLSAGPAVAQGVNCASIPSMMVAEPAEYTACHPASATDKPVDPALATTLFGSSTTAPAFGINLRAGSTTTRGFISFNATNPATTTPVLATTDNFYGGDYAGNNFSQIYAVLVPTAPAIPDLYLIDTATGARTLIGTTGLPAGASPTDMAWDYTTSTMYLMEATTAGTTTTSSIYTLNLTTGAATFVATVSGGAFALGINMFIHPTTGVMYSVDLNLDDLFSINKTTGAATVIGDIGYNLNFAQGADFDNATGTAYLCAYQGAGVNTLRTVDLATGLSTSVGSFNNAEVDICAIGTAAGPPPTGPALSASPGAVAFGNTTAVGTTSTRTVTLTNSGTATTTISSISVSGASFAVNTTGTNLTLAPNASTTFTVSFSPTNTTAASGTVTIASNATGSPLVINLTGTGFAPPPNDNIANATVLTGTTGTLTGTSVNATLETGEPAPSCQSSHGASVWWSFTPPQTGTLSVDLSATAFDTILTMHQPGTTQIGCDDDGATTPNTLASILTNIPVTAGTPVLIRVAGYAGAGGTGTPATGSISGTFSFTGTTASEGTAGMGRTSLTATPNPVRGAARVRFVSATAQDVTVAVYDVTGRQVATLFQGTVAADQAVEASLQAASLPSGVYVVRATGAGLNLTQRVTVVR